MKLDKSTLKNFKHHATEGLYFDFDSTFKKALEEGDLTRASGALFSAYSLCPALSIPDGEYPVEFLALYIKYSLKKIDDEAQKKVLTPVFVERLQKSARVFYCPEEWEELSTVSKYEQKSGIILTITNGGSVMALKKASTEGTVGSTEKPAKVKKEKQERGESVSSTVIKLLCEKKFTDDQIIAEVLKTFSDKTDEKKLRVIMSCKRGDINGGRIEHLKSFAPIEKLVEHDGKVIPYSKAPKAEKTKKVDPEKDLLNTVAGLDIGKKKKEVPKEKLPAAEKSAAKKSEAKKNPPNKK